MATGGLLVDFQDRTLILTLANAPSNGLTPALRAALLTELATPFAGCDSVVLAGAGVNFSSLLPMEPDTAQPSLADLCRAVSGASVPVVAAIQGLAMGPGAELALAAHARIGAPGCRIAFPEVALGLCPTAGSTRRLPQRVGASAALQLLLTGRVVPDAEALGLGLLDELATGPLLPAAIALAEGLARGQSLPGQGLVRPPEAAASWQAAVAAARRAHVGALPATRRITDCVEAALLLPAESADSFETVARTDLEATPEAAALCAIAQAERRAARLPAAVARAEPVPLTTLGLVGEAPALVLLARAALRERIPLRWLHPSRRVMMASLGPFDPDPKDLQHVEDSADLNGLALQVHATAPIAGPLRTHSDGTALVVLDGAEGEMGLSIAPSGRACEVSILAEEAPQAIATAVAGLRRLRLVPLLVGHRPGLGRTVMRAGDLALARLAASGVALRQLAAAVSAYGVRLPDTQGAATARDMTEAEICNRWLGAMTTAGLRLLDQGVARRPSDIDHLLVAGYGFPRWKGGPMHLADRRGLLVLRHDLRLWAAEDPVWTPASLLDRLIQDGRRLSVLDGSP
ncbi:enoyl-CoA hydratase/isomerase family protein [Tabrizicola piscis]|uniref:Enoyl-CoA hydratase/isomerase family protein n=1 Tax=Tabrizicola piscis TaxID=2494374 RepID=A0A3S8U1N0_9RHOB|nr:enoyl-CoA hydratase-related protein [Tabrizicola piscis]AZL57465.1 enoyl-CoA hydratase/isomerase family protein [Tabrizicola piscis]